MGFAVDKVSEDSFYENLLLGVSRILENCWFVSDLSLERIPGVRQVDIRNWEHNHGLILPEDLRAFYSSTNGFLYKYSFSYDVNCDEAKKHFQTGSIEVNPLESLSLIYDYDTNNTAAEIVKNDAGFKLQLTKDSKVFQLASVYNGHVVIVYLNNYSTANVWLYTANMQFHYLADDFTTYFRMSIAHLGIPCWQFLYAPEGLPEWSKEIFHLIAPGILVEDKQNLDLAQYSLINEITNKIDSNIFAGQNQLASSVLNVKESPTKQTTQRAPKTSEKRPKYPLRHSQSTSKLKLKSNP